MTTEVQGTNGVSNVQMGAVSMPGGLTPEGILAYCAMQLGSFDDEIKGKMNNQEKQRAASTALTDLKTKLAAKDHIDGNMAPADKQAILDAFKKAYDALPPNDPHRGQIDDAFRKFAATACTNDVPTPGLSLATVTKDELTSMANTADMSGTVDANGVPVVNRSNYVDTNELRDLTKMLDDVLGGISKNAEVAMIEIQSAVSRRQQAVQFATNMLSKYNDGLQSVVSNLGK